MWRTDARVNGDTVAARTVSTVARLAGITVRTLHHYDDIGLLVPSGRSEAGYRLYEPEDLDRLQQILFYRELGVALDEIRDIVGDPAFDRVATLRAQRDELQKQSHRIDRMIGAVEAAIRAEETGMRLTEEEKFEVFGDFDPAEHEAEAEEHWGETDAWAQSRTRTTGYSKEDWLAIRAEADSISTRMAQLMEDGVEPTSAEAMDVAEEHRMHIGSRFYDCSREMHANLAHMWTVDDRFRTNIDKAGEGLTDYFAAAVAANAAR